MLSDNHLQTDRNQRRLLGNELKPLEAVLGHEILERKLVGVPRPVVHVHLVAFFLVTNRGHSPASHPRHSKLCFLDGLAGESSDSQLLVADDDRRDAVGFGEVADDI